MIIFGVGSIFGALFVAFAMEETSGIPLDTVGLDEKRGRKNFKLMLMLHLME